MSKIYVGDGNSFVWQWQPKEQIVLEGYPEGVFVHFANCDTVKAPVVQSRMEGDKLVADIPPELMQSDKDITVYVCDADSTMHCYFLSVLNRPKPESYVTEPVEVLRYESLAAKIPFNENYEGKLLFVQNGVAIPLAPGDGVEVVRQEDGTFALVARGGSSGAGNWDELEGKPVYMQGAQEKFDPAWLPDGGFGWAETGEATVEWDGSTEELDVVAVGDMTLVRVSGLLPSAKAMVGRTVEMADGTTYEITENAIEQSGPVWAVLGPVGDDLLPVLYGIGVTEVDGIAFPATGMYAVLYPDQPYRFARVAITYETIHKLDPKFLPEEAVREYIIELDYSKTVVTSSDKDVLVGKIPNDLRYTEILDAYASGQRLVVRLKNTHYPKTYLQLVNVGDREWTFEADVGSRYTPSRIQKLYLTLINQDISKDTVTARVAYINVELGGGAEQVQADWGQNDPEAPDYVKGRTHWEEGNQTVIEWDGSAESLDGTDSVDINGNVFYKISSATPSYDDLIGSIWALDGQSVELTEEMASAMLVVSNRNIMYSGDGLAVIYDTSFDSYDQTFAAPSIGTYVAPAGWVAFSITYGSTIVHQLDEKWIPDSIARKTDIPGKLSDMENDLFFTKEVGRWNIAPSDMTNVGTDSEPLYNFSAQKLNNPCIFNASVSINGEVSEMRAIKAVDNELQAHVEFDFGFIDLMVLNGFELNIGEFDIIPSDNLNVYCVIDGEVPINAVTFEVIATEKKLIPSEMIDAKSKIYTGAHTEEPHEAEYIYIPAADNYEKLDKFEIYLDENRRPRVNIYPSLVPMAVLLGRVEAEPAPAYATADYALTIDRFVPNYGWEPGIDYTYIRIKLDGVEYQAVVTGVNHTLQTGTLYTKDGKLYGIELVGSPTGETYEIYNSIYSVYKFSGTMTKLG